MTAKFLEKFHWQKFRKFHWQKITKIVCPESMYDSNKFFKKIVAFLHGNGTMKKLKMTEICTTIF